jgi:hypothetical protein
MLRSIQAMRRVSQERRKRVSARWLPRATGFGQIRRSRTGQRRKLGTEEAGFHARLDADGIPPQARLVRRVARAGFADHGLALSVDTLWPEPTLAADGAWWHPVAIAEADMQVASTPLPLITVLAVIHATLNDPTRDRGAALAAFRCT